VRFPDKRECYADPVDGSKTKGDPVTFVDEFDFRYAMTYSYNNRQEVDFDSDLSELTDLACMDGYSSVSFYERMDGIWMQIDASEEMAQSREKALLEAQKETGLKPAEWRVWVFGPKNIGVWWSSHFAEEDAIKRASELPAEMRATVTKEDSGDPREWANPPILEDITRMNGEEK
jgi:hypothetical protein